jgi:hypothetical protein
MRTPFFRVFVFGFIALNVVAIGVGRMVGPAFTWRRLEPVRRAAINAYLAGQTTPGLRYLDLESGSMECFDLPQEDHVDEASWSPWRDDRGRSQVVARWRSRSGQGVDVLGRKFGLARYSFPDGEVLDRVNCDLAPGSPPCWLPGLAARVLFAANDGNLYRFDFEGAGANSDGRDHKPREVIWNCDRPGGRRVYLGEPFRPLDARFTGFLFVSLYYESMSKHRVELSSREIWWLRLNSDSTVIESAGRLTDPETPKEVYERYPVAARGANGESLLAYLTHDGTKPGWDLRVAPLELSGSVPVVRAASTRVVTRNCLPSPPVLSPDGRWIAATSDEQGTRFTRRLDIAPPRPARRELAGGPQRPHS